MGAATEMDPDAAEEFATKQEFRRAEERYTQKHENTSKWAKDIMHRGLHVQDERTRKMNSLEYSNSDDEDESSDIDSGPDESEIGHDLLRVMWQGL
ncbi:OLC1v1005868C1 [Oldenlandia corymbosa var. corymbosa]|uniref:OLC1v1005868C1 n=1 Tax=Oldenlandia corymbosa var. corymbosa TaxID=529605 RepID=A0AAV1DHZ8_OLDCO|nr:OLC1v1005868C1 [Oldenlandia corymbosa var. corymbosa]